MSKKRIKTIPKEDIIKAVKEAYSFGYLSTMDKIYGRNKLEDLNTVLTSEGKLKSFNRFLEYLGEIVYVFWDDNDIYREAEEGKQFTANDIIEHIYDKMLKNGAYTYEEWIKITGLDQM